MFTWGKDNTLIADAIRRSPSLLRIILKTRNERQLIERWISHYLPIVGESAKLIILDHMSDDEQVLEAYERHADRLIIIRFTGSADTAHSLKRFQDMYEAVWDSSAFYALLDTDEYLCFFDGFRLIRDERLLGFLEKHRDASLFPALGLANILQRDNAFVFDSQDLPHYHLSGKPILNSSLMSRKLVTPVGHNRDVPTFLYENTPMNLVLLHLCNWSKDQRIMANMQKLHNFGMVDSETNLDAALALDVESLHLTQARQYVSELRFLCRTQDLDEVTSAELQGPHMRIGENDKPQFFPATLKDEFKRHVNANMSFFDAIGLPENSIADPRLPVSMFVP